MKIFNFTSVKMVVMGLLTFLFLVVIANAFAHKGQDLAEVATIKGKLVPFAGANNINFYALDGVSEARPRVIINYRNKPEPRVSAQRIQTSWFENQGPMEVDIRIPTIKSTGHALGLSHSPDKASFFAECKSSTEAFNLYRAPLVEYSTILVKVPRNFCDSDIRVVLETKQDNVLIGMSAPRSVNMFERIFIYEGIFIVGIVFAVISLLLIILPIALLVKDRLKQVSLQFVALGLVGYFSYFCLAKGFLNLIAFEILIFIYAIAAIVFMFLAPAERWKQVNYTALGFGLFATVLVALSAEFSKIPMNARIFAFSAYPATWAVDVVISYHFAMDVFISHLGNWKQTQNLGAFSATDRGFISSGWIIWASGYLDGLRLFDHGPLRISTALFTIIFVQAWAVFAVISSIVSDTGIITKIPKRKLWVGYLIIAMSPIFYVGIYFTWPKYIAGAFAFLSLYLFAKLVRRFTQTRSYIELGLSFFIVGLLFCLAVNIHNGVLFIGTAFAFIAFWIYYTGNEKKRWVDLGLSIGSGIALITFLICFEALNYSIAEKTTYGSTYVFTGSGKFGLDADGVRQHIVNFYETRSFSQLWDLKLQRLKLLAWNNNPITYMGETGVNARSAVRSLFFTNFLMSIWPFYLLFIARYVHPEGQKNTSLRETNITVFGTMLGLIVFLGISYGYPHLFVLPYAAYLAIFIWFIVNANRIRWTYLALICALVASVHIYIWLLPAYKF